MNDYKRKTREMPQYVKDKISAAMMGHRHSDETREKISLGQKKAWAQIPPKDLTLNSTDHEKDNESSH